MVLRRKLGVTMAEDQDRWVISKWADRPGVMHWANDDGFPLCRPTWLVPSDFVPAWKFTGGHMARECVKCSQALTRMGL